MDAGSTEWISRRVMVTAGNLADRAWAVAEPNLRGLTDDEYFWEPVAGMWGVRRRAEVRRMHRDDRAQAAHPVGDEMQRFVRVEIGVAPRGRHDRYPPVFAGKNGAIDGT